jgi:hypothetical protein
MRRRRPLGVVLSGHLAGLRGGLELAAAARERCWRRLWAELQDWSAFERRACMDKMRVW